MVRSATTVASMAPIPTYINVELIPLILLPTLPDPGSVHPSRSVLNPTSERRASCRRWSTLFTHLTHELEIAANPVTLEKLLEQPSRTDEYAGRSGSSSTGASSAPTTRTPRSRRRRDCPAF